MDQNVEYISGWKPDDGQTGRRFDYLDNIKWALAILVILHHSAAIAGLDPFLINFPKVIESERYQYHILLIFQSVNQGFFMSLFFFISAYFVAPSYEKKGAPQFLRGRLVRLGIPVLMTIFFIDPLGFYICGNVPLQASINEVVKTYATMLKSYNMIMGVTWFCWALIVFNVIFVLIRSTGLLNKETTPKQRPLPSMPTMIIFSIAMIPLNYLGLYLMDVLGKDFLGFHLLKYFPMYGAMFCLGIQAQKNNWIEQLTYKHVFFWLVIWIVARIFLFPLSQMASRPFEVLGMSIIMLYSFKTLFNRKNVWAKRLSRSAYAAYVIQVVPLCIIGKTLMPHMTQFPVLNFIMVGVPGVILTFALAHYLCKLPLLNRIF